MATSFLIKKWRRLFKTFDLTKDDVLSVEDAHLFADRFIESQKLIGKAADDYKREYVEFFKAFFLKGATHINEEQMVESMTNQYNKNKKEFEADMKEQIEKVVRITDVNKDNKISREEFMEALKAMGLHTFDEMYFNSYPRNEDGTIPSRLFLDSWVLYLCNSDETQISELEKARLYGFRIIDTI